MGRRFRTIYTTAYVGDIDVEVGIDELLREVDDDELLDEMKDRKLSYRGCVPDAVDLEGDYLYRVLCDIVQVGYHTDKSEVLKLLSNKF